MVLVRNSLCFAFAVCIFSQNLRETMTKNNTKTSLQDDSQKIYIRGVQCNFSDTFAYKNKSCFAKSYSRDVSTVNVIVTAKMPITSILVEVKLFYKYGTIYREVMHTPVFNWCQMSKENLSNPMIKQLLQVVRDTAPSLIHSCPYLGVELRNCSVDSSSMLSVFPTGDYKMMFFISNEIGDRIGVCNVIGNIQSSNRDTFG